MGDIKLIRYDPSVNLIRDNRMGIHLTGGKDVIKKHDSVVLLDTQTRMFTHYGVAAYIRTMLVPDAQAEIGHPAEFLGDRVRVVRISPIMAIDEPVRASDVMLCDPTFSQSSPNGKVIPTTLDVFKDIVANINVIANAARKDRKKGYRKSKSRSLDSKDRLMIASMALCGLSSVADIAEEYGVSSGNVYSWRDKLEKSHESIFQHGNASITNGILGDMSQKIDKVIKLLE